QHDIRIAKTPWEDWSAIQWRDIAAGAQTERRGGAGPVRGLLGSKDLTGRFVSRPLSVLRGTDDATLTTSYFFFASNSATSFLKSSWLRSGASFGSFFISSTLLKPFVIACRRSASALSG